MRLDRAYRDLLDVFAVRHLLDLGVREGQVQAGVHAVFAAALAVLSHSGLLRELSALVVPLEDEGPWVVSICGGLCCILGRKRLGKSIELYDDASMNRDYDGHETLVIICKGASICGAAFILASVAGK